MVVQVLLVTIVGALLVAGLVLPVWAFIDIMRRPEEQWTRSEQNKLFWILFIVLTLLACGASWIVPTIYLVTIRPKLDAVEEPGSDVDPPPRPPLPEVEPPA
jgi:hypothetical protein